MPARIGPLLEITLHRLDAARLAGEDELQAVAAMVGTESGEGVPIVIKMELDPPRQGEDWKSYRSRIESTLLPLRDKIEKLMGIRALPLIAAKALAGSASPDQVGFLKNVPDIELLELDPLVRVINLDNARLDLGMDVLLSRHPTLDGSGVRVAVLDSGVDTAHPTLNVAASVETCGEPVAIPGDHGTHCAGGVASRDSIFTGIAPEVDLLNIKVLRSNGTGQHTFITRGIDEALDRDAHILSMSIGFNHLPRWSTNGHGWSCVNGDCPLCTAVDNAVALENRFVVVAAGNEHERAEELRGWGYGNTFDTELGCPGNARQAFTVGAMTKNTFLPASFSSRGPTSYGVSKPDLAAPGVNVWSTVTVPRDPQGNPVNNPPRTTLFRRMSGTSMATPLVAGAAALVIQKRLRDGQPWTPASLRNELLTQGVLALPFPVNVVGAGRLNLSHI